MDREMGLLPFKKDIYLEICKILFAGAGRGALRPAPQRHESENRKNQGGWCPISKPKPRTLPPASTGGAGSGETENRKPQRRGPENYLYTPRR
jgi:hypothetical protein